jgi:biopolymer transport protein ExbD
MRFYVRAKRKPSIIIVSLVDILTILLIFFVVTTTFKKAQPIMKIELPEAGTAEKVPSHEPLIITLTPPPGEKIMVGGNEVPMAQLLQRLKAAREKNPEVKIALQSDKRASFGLVVRVMDIARRAGFDQLPAFIEQEKGKPGTP